MTNNSDVKSPVETKPSSQANLSAATGTHAPFLYFDNAPVFGYFNGVVRVTLEVFRDMNGPNREVVTDRVIVGHLRMSIEAAKSLKSALEGALLIAMPAQNRPSESEGAPKVN